MTLARLSHVLDRVESRFDAQSKKELAAGLAVQFLESRWGTNHVGEHLKRVLGAINAGQYEFYFNRIARPLGFVTWALVTVETTEDWIASGYSTVLSAKWDDGGDLWIVDFFSQDGSFKDVSRDLFAHRLSAHGFVRYWRQRGQRHLLRQFSRRHRHVISPIGNELLSARNSSNLTTNAILLADCEEEFQRAREIGKCVFALHHAGISTSSRVWRSSYLLGEFVGMRQYRVYYSLAGEPGGLLTWSWLSNYTISRIAQVPLHDAHSSEWNEGSTLCLCDAALSDIVREGMLSDIFHGLFPEETSLLLYVPPACGAPARLLSVDRMRQHERIVSWLGAVSTGAPWLD